MKLNRRLIKAAITTIIIFALVLGCITAYFKKSTDYTAVSSSETNTTLSNPYIGWYSLIGYTLSDSGLSSVPSSYLTADSPTELVLLEINLRNYADCDISVSGLSNLDLLLSEWSDTKKQLILRFVYDWDGNNLQTEPSSRSQIERHIEQVAPFINKYKKSVYLLQGIFVGNWGEMNNTTHMGNGEMETLIQKLDDVIDPSIFLSVRTPAQWRTIVSEYRGTKVPRCPQPNLCKR